MANENEMKTSSFISYTYRLPIPYYESIFETITSTECIVSIYM